MTDVAWSAQFTGVLESLRMAPLFAAGRRFARAGYVTHLTISTSVVMARVRDDDESTYRVRIALRAFTGDEWTRIEHALAGQAYYAAMLLAGHLPRDLDRVFTEAGLSLFPETVGDLAMDCACADWQVPCRHLAAACYVLAESFDLDPFGILAWRGRGREELLDRLRVLRGSPAVPLPSGVRPDRLLSAEPEEAEIDLDSFWLAGDLTPASRSPRPVAGSVRRPDAVLDQLDPLGLTLDGRDVVELLRPAYRALVDGGA